MPPAIKRLPSKIRIADGYHRLARSMRLGSSKSVQPSPVAEVHGPSRRMAWLPGLMIGFPGKPVWSPPMLACSVVSQYQHKV